MPSFQRVLCSMELELEDVSLLERCPHLRGCYVQASRGGSVLIAVVDVPAVSTLAPAVSGPPLLPPQLLCLLWLDLAFFSLSARVCACVCACVCVCVCVCACACMCVHMSV